MKYLIKGGKKLSGTVRISGSKNAVLPILAATIITGKKSIIHNCPNISDVLCTIEILRYLGCYVDFRDGTLTIDSSGPIKESVPSELMSKLRSSIIFLGAFINRCRSAEISYPGGCELGARPIDIHLSVLKELGVKVTEEVGKISCVAKDLKEGEYKLLFPSVGATENVMIASLIVDGTVIIKNAAKEPEIIDLQNFLNASGATISGAGTDTIVIEKMKEYNDVTYTVLSDRIEAATYMAVAAATGSTIKLENAPVNDLDSIITMLKAMGVYVVPNGKSELTIIAPSRLRPLDIVTTMPHPGFPTDAQAILMATLLKAKGSSMIVENIFERRYNHIPELIKMGADIAVNGNTAKISGVEKLSGAVVAAKDLRAGASLIIAALQAEGETVIYDVHHIDRGYENIVGKLRNIGADIREMGDGSEKWAAFFTS